MTASELVAGDLTNPGALGGRPGDVWRSNGSWNRPGRTIAELEAAGALQRNEGHIARIDRAKLQAYVVEQ